MWVQTDRSTASSEPCGLPDRAVVVGIGTVGLHRALSLDRIGIDVTGYDIDETAVAAYRRGVDATGVIGDDDIAASDCTFTTDPDCIGDADAVFVAFQRTTTTKRPRRSTNNPTATGLARSSGAGTG